MAKKKGKGNNKLAIASLALAITSALIMFFWPNADTIAYVLIVVCGVAAVVCGIIGNSQIKKSKEEGKVFATAGIIMGIILVILIVMIYIGLQAIKDVSFNDQVYCKQVSSCVDNGDGTSTCLFMDELEMPCTTEYLTESQFKK